MGSTIADQPVAMVTHAAQPMTEIMQTASTQSPDTGELIDARFHFSFFPKEIVQQIFSYLSSKDLLRLSPVSKQFQENVNTAKTRRVDNHEWIINWDKTGELADWTGTDEELREWVGLVNSVDTNWKTANPNRRKALLAKSYATLRMLETKDDHVGPRTYPDFLYYLNEITQLDKDHPNRVGLQSLISIKSLDEALLKEAMHKFYYSYPAIKEIVTNVSKLHAERVNEKNQQAQLLRPILNNPQLSRQDKLSLQFVVNELVEEAQRPSEVFVTGGNIYGRPRRFDFTTGEERQFARWLFSIEKTYGQVDERWVTVNARTRHEGLVFDPDEWKRQSQNVKQDDSKE